MSPCRLTDLGYRDQEDVLIAESQRSSLFLSRANARRSGARFGGACRVLYARPISDATQRPVAASRERLLGKAMEIAGQRFALGPSCVDSAEYAGDSLIHIPRPCVRRIILKELKASFF